MAILETTFLIDVLRDSPGTEKIVHSLAGEQLYVAAPTVMELWNGALQSSFAEEEKRKIDALLESLIILPLDEKSAKEAGEIEAYLAKKGEIIEAEDIMIGAIAVVNGEKLITRDQHYARIPQLRMEKY